MTPAKNAARAAEIMALRARGLGCRRIAEVTGYTPGVCAGVIFRAERGAHPGPVRGESHHNAKLTEAGVLEIKARRLAGEPMGSIAHDFGVSLPLVSQIVNGKIWRHVGEPA